LATHLASSPCAGTSGPPNQALNWTVDSQSFF
jgi:hypothetical protein